jgi:hypothetical protein
VGSTTGGSLSNGTYYIWYTLSTSPGNGVTTGETPVVSTVTSITLSGGTSTQSIAVQVPSVSLLAGTINWYVSTANVSTGALKVGSVTAGSGTTFTITSTSGTGNPPTTNTTLAHGLVAIYAVDNGAETALTLSIGTYGTFVAAGALAESATTPGKYSIDLPNAIWASGGKLLRIDVQGLLGLQAEPVFVALGYSLNPGVAVDANGRMQVQSGTAVGQISLSSGLVSVSGLPTNFASLAIASTGQVGVDLSNIKQATSATTLTNITVPAVTAVGSVSGSVGSVTGTVTATLGTGSITAATFASGAITSTVLAQSAADLVWNSTTRVLTAGTNIALAKGTGLTGLNDIAAAAVWSVSRSGNQTAGTFGEGVASVQGPLVGNITGNVTGNLSGSVGSVTGAVTLNLSQTGLSPRALDNVADASLTVGDALVAAIAGAVGKEAVSGTSYIVQTPFTGTTVRSFTLNSATAPTSRA